jgi:DNA-binding NtrC family response regulator
MAKIMVVTKGSFVTTSPHEPPPSQEAQALDAIVGQSDWILQLRAVIRAVAAYSSSVLISGASGTGKELVARAIHNHSPRSGNRFIPVDCASITGSLFASHMFGHLKGAFTGASHNAVGCFRAADGGTIFLDEIGELDTELQAKLLRVLQERVVTPVGSHDGSPVDVRVIAATNRDLQAEVAAGRFREDLYFRLNVVSIQTCPLRERGDDIDLLADHCLRRLAVDHGMPLKRLSPAARRQLRAYIWPGNVRELENAIERAILFSPGEWIEADQLPGDCPDFCPSKNGTVPFATSADDVQTLSFGAAAADREIAHVSHEGRWLTAAEVEREHIIRTLEHTGHNQSAAARLLDIDRHQLRRRMAEYGLMTPGEPRRGRPANSAPRKAA